LFATLEEVQDRREDSNLWCFAFELRPECADLPEFSR
jgi:hypothetical protein